MSAFASLSQELGRAVAALSPSLVTVPGLAGSATGLVWSEGGLVLTTARIATRRDELPVVLADGRRAAARVVGRDLARDLAVLQVEGEGPFTPASLGEDDSLAVGHLVLMLGRPDGDVRATLGLVQRLGGAWTTPGGVSIDRLIEVDGNLLPGSSGGPLVSAEGRVVGLNTAGIVRGGTTLPISTLRAVVPALVARGLVQRGWLGVSVSPVEVSQGAGLLVGSIEAGSPAAVGGLLVGDILLAVNETRTPTPPTLSAALAELGAGASLTLHLLRGGAPLSVPLTLGARGRRCC